MLVFDMGMESAVGLMEVMASGLVRRLATF